MGAPENSEKSDIDAPDPLQRARVYRLNDDGKWDDQGTGQVTVDYLERSEEMGLFVIDEDENETILMHRINSEDIYRKQEETIISWRDPEFSTELALSFQEKTGCSYIWDQMCSVQRSMHFSSLTNDTYNVNNVLRELPPVELSTLPLILKTVTESGIQDQLRVIELILHDQEFFQKLMDLFRICEDLENIDGLLLIFKIVRGIILLNNPEIFEKIFGDELIMDIIGCLEYDPDVPRIHHRNFLKEHVVFKEAIPIKDPVVLSKIHQTYRVGYVKDVILPRALDEAIIASLNSMIHSNNALVVSLLKDDTTFIKELFAMLKSPTTSVESRKTLVHFLHEFCTLSKSLQMVHQMRLFRDLVNEGIFDIIADVLQSEDKKLVLTVTDILILFVNLDSNILRTYVTRQEGLLFGLLVKNMLADFGDDMHSQFLEILLSLLDSRASPSQRDAIVEMFYEKHFGELIDAITSSCPPKVGGQIGRESIRSDGGFKSQSRAKPEVLLNICDLLCFCVLHHAYRIKCNFLLNNVIDKVLHLTKRREKYLVVAAVRFVRTLVSRSDEHLTNHLVKNNLFKPIIDIFVANGDRYNLLNSAVLELFEHIRKDNNSKVLLRYLIDTFWDQLAKFEHLSSIRALKLKYEQSLESAGIRSTGVLLEERKRNDERALEKEEEDYFNEDSDEEDSASARTVTPTRGQSQHPVVANGSSLNQPSPRSGGLVDYDDDEDDDDYRPPPKRATDASKEDEEVAEFPLKRKLVSKDDPEPKKVRMSAKVLKPKEGVFAALCSTLSQAVLPTKKALTPDADKKSEIEPNLEENGSVSSSGDSQNADIENHTNKEEQEEASRSFTDGLNDSVGNRQRGDDCPLLPPTSSPEMAVSGS